MATRSTWSTSGAFIVGNSGSGRLTVSNYAEVSAAVYFAVGQLNGSIGRATIESGGIVVSTGQIIVGNTAGSDGVVYVQGGRSPRWKPPGR